MSTELLERTTPDAWARYLQWREKISDKEQVRFDEKMERGEPAPRIPTRFEQRQSALLDALHYGYWIHRGVRYSTLESALFVAEGLIGFDGDRHTELLKREDEFASIEMLAALRERPVYGLTPSGAAQLERLDIVVPDDYPLMEESPDVE